MLMIPDAARFLIATIYLIAGLALFNMVVKNYRFKVNVGLFDMFAASFVGLFCFSAAVTMIIVV